MEEMQHNGLKSILHLHNDTLKYSNTEILVHKININKLSSKQQPPRPQPQPPPQSPPPPTTALLSSPSRGLLQSLVSSIGDMIGTESGFHPIQFNEEKIVNKCTKSILKVRKSVGNIRHDLILLPTLTCKLKLRKKCMDGHVILEADKMDFSSYVFESHRQDGRLILNLIVPFQAH